MLPLGKGEDGVSLNRVDGFHGGIELHLWDGDGTSWELLIQVLGRVVYTGCLYVSTYCIPIDSLPVSPMGLTSSLSLKLFTLRHHQRSIVLPQTLPLPMPNPKDSLQVSPYWARLQPFTLLLSSSGTLFSFSLPSCYSDSSQTSLTIPSLFSSRSPRFCSCPCSAHSTSPWESHLLS